MKKELKKIEQEPTECKEKKYSKCYVYNLPHNDEMCEQCEFNPKKKKPTEWSEEDERKLAESIALIRSNNTGTFYYEKDELSSFLKSLKSRVQSQSKQEWSEEDENHKANTIHFLEASKKYFKKDEDIVYDERWIDTCIEWLKSLRPQNTWKPSDDQMEGLAWALSLAKNCGEECAFDLRTLQEELKKLRDE